MESIGERIKRLRKNIGITQEELAEKIGLEGAAVSKYETNRVPLTQESLLRLSAIFNVSTDYILTGKNAINEPIEIAASMKDGLDLSDMGENDKKVIMDLYTLLKSKEKDKSE
mgnify:CR=1 FL=1